MSSDPSRPDQPEYLGEAPPTDAAPGPRRRTPVLGLAAVAVAGVVGLGGWAAVSLMSGGSQPAEAVPANAIGYVSLDLDPSASQKIEAVKLLRKFPAIDKELEISSQDDLRRWMFEQIQEEGTCKNLDYEEDVAPWIGDRIAAAGVPAERAGDSPTPLIALQVSDQEAAADGIAKIAECGEAGEDFGFAFAGDYAVISDSENHAESLAAAAEEDPLADDATFQKWTDRVGEPGIITMYAAPGAVDALIELQSDMSDELGSMAGAPQGRAMLRAQSELEQMNKRTAEQMKALSEGFKGMAAVVRFEGGAVEAQFAGESTSEGLGVVTSPEDRADISDLPAGTAAAFAVGLPDGWAQAYLDAMGPVMGDDQTMKQMLEQAEAMTGLDLPEDIERLLGDGVAVALDKDLDVQTAAQDPTSIPAGIRVSGDPREIREAVDKVKKAVGPDAESLVVEEGDGVVALGLDPDYVRTLAEAGGLGDDAVFQDVVPDADRAGGALFVNFDSVEEWVAQAMSGAGQMGPDEKQVRENLAPLRALGMSSWVEDDGSQGGLLRLSTD